MSGVIACSSHLSSHVSHSSGMRRPEPQSSSIVSKNVRPKSLTPVQRPSVRTVPAPPPDLREGAPTIREGPLHNQLQVPFDHLSDSLTKLQVAVEDFVTTVRSGGDDVRQHQLVSVIGQRIKEAEAHVLSFDDLCSAHGYINAYLEHFFALEHRTRIVLLDMPDSRRLEMIRSLHLTEHPEEFAHDLRHDPMFQRATALADHVASARARMRTKDECFL